MRSLSKFIKELTDGEVEIAAFCSDAIGFLRDHGYQTTDLPERVGPIPRRKVAHLTTVAELRLLMDEHRLPDPQACGGSGDAAENPHLAVESVAAGSTRTSAAPGGDAPALTAPPVIFPDTAAEPVESMVSAVRPERSATTIGLPLPEFAGAFQNRAEMCQANRNRVAETARLMPVLPAPTPVMELLPDAGHSGMVAMRRIIGPSPAVGTMESAVAEAIILGDDRVQVVDTLVHPFRWLCRLEITAATGSKWLGTGWFISPGVIATAGHCVFIHNHGGWVQSIAVHVGQNRDHVARSVLATQFATTHGWAEARDATHDYGVIFVEAGDQGYFGYGVLDDGVIAGGIGNISGYPQDKPAGTLWGHSKQLRPPLPQTLLYEIDTFGGMSGAPVVMWDGRDYVAIGIHNYGDTMANNACRITEQVFYNFERWKSLGAVI